MIKRSPESDALLRHLLLQRQYVTPQQFAQAHAEAGEQGDLLQILFQQGALQQKQVEVVKRLYAKQTGDSDALQHSGTSAADAAPGASTQPRQTHTSPPAAPAAKSGKPSMAAFLGQTGAVPEETLQKAKRLQAKHPDMSLLKVLVKMKAISPDQARALQQQYKSAAAGQQPAQPAPAYAAQPAPAYAAQPAPAYAAQQPQGYAGQAGGYGPSPYGHPHAAPQPAYQAGYAHPHGHGVQVPGAFHSPELYWLRKLAKAQRLMIRSFAAQIAAAVIVLLFVVTFGESGDPNLLLAGIAIIGVLAIIGFGIAYLVGYFLTAAHIDQLPLYIILFLAGIFIPFVSLVAMIILIVASTQKLKSYGIPVGLLGVNNENMP